jgi:hypothetical protein
MSDRPPEVLDDVDRLFARLEPAPVPEQLTARVLASTVARAEAPAGVAWPWLLATLGALVALAATGYSLGARLAASDGLEVILAVWGDLSLLGSAPGDVLVAVAKVLPWELVLLAALCAAFGVWTVGRVAADASRARTRASG